MIVNNFWTPGRGIPTAAASCVGQSGEDGAGAGRITRELVF